jgi:hypothetical protein
LLISALARPKPAPELAYFWITQTTSHGIRGWAYVRDLYLHHQSTANIQLTITCDGVSEIYIIPHSSGIPMRTYLRLRPQKGLLWSYSITSALQFRLFKSGSFIRIKPWGANEFMELNQFGGTHGAGAEI